MHLFLNNNLHHSSRHQVQALCASAEPLELSVHYPEPPSSEPATGETNADKPNEQELEKTCAGHSSPSLSNKNYGYKYQSLGFFRTSETSAFLLLFFSAVEPKLSATTPIPPQECLANCNPSPHCPGEP